MNHKKDGFCQNNPWDFQLLFNSLPMPAYWQDVNSVYQGCNEPFHHLIGMTEVNGKTDYDMPWAVYAERMQLNDKQVLKHNTSQEFEEHIPIGQGKYTTLLIRKAPLTNSQGEILGLIGVFLDISARKTQESTLKQLNEETESTLENIVANMPGHVYWKSAQGVYLGCNIRQARSLGFRSPSEVIGKTDFDLPWDEKVAAEYQLNDNRIIQNGKAEIIEEESQMQGQKKIVLSHKTPMINRKGKITGVLGISLDITDRKKMECELHEAKERAEAANQAKTEFIANMSHDIRTPLTGLIGMAEDLEQELQENEQKEKAYIIHECGKELFQMLDTILADVKAGDVKENQVDNKSFPLYECIEDLVKLQKPTTLQKNLDLIVEIEDTVPHYIVSDRKKLHRILLNLLGNAIKFTKKGSIKIQVACLNQERDQVHLLFSVADTGIGIPQDSQDKVFERFFRVTPSYKGLYKGYGLGLHIVQSYVHLLNGNITLRSEEGVGTTFSFDLHCQIGTPQQAQNQIKKTPTVRQQPADKGKNKVPTLLLIEDNPSAMKVLISRVSKAGCHFAQADNAEEALSLFMTNSFDLVITDLGLPGMSGCVLVSQIRDWEKKQGKTPVPILALTGHDTIAIKEECLAAGMNGVLTKPASKESIEAFVKQFVFDKHESADLNKKSASDQTIPLGGDLPNTEPELFDLEQFPLFDVELAMKQLGNDSSLLISMLKDFISDSIQQDIFSLHEAYQNQDWLSIENLAHKIKGGVGYTGNVRLKYACQYLERYVKTGHTKHLDRLYHQLVEVNQSTVAELSAWLKTRGE